MFDTNGKNANPKNGSDPLEPLVWVDISQTLASPAFVQDSAIYSQKVYRALDLSKFLAWIFVSNNCNGYRRHLSPTDPESHRMHLLIQFRQAIPTIIFNPTRCHMKSAIKSFVLTLALIGFGCDSLRAQESEKKVTLDQVPALVKAGIEKATGKGKLIDIGEISLNGKTTYEIELQLDGKELDVVFDAKGAELSRQIEGDIAANEDEDEGKEGEDEDADEASSVNFQHFFDLEHREFSTTGRNRYFVLEPGYQLVLEGKDGKHAARLEITVLDETKELGDIQTRVVEERETVDGKLVEVSRNFFAICKSTSSVFYFGEEVDIYKDGKVVEHEGAWLHGQDKASAGMMMPGECLIGAAYYQENAPEKAMDRARIESVSATLKTPAGEFTNCLKVWEENPLDHDSETKTFAPNIGLVQDEGLLLVKHGFIKK